jgi:hypothetical protein
MSDIDCPICGRQVAPLESDWRGHTCSPECARTKAIVDAIKGIEAMIAERLPELMIGRDGEPILRVTDPAFNPADLVAAMGKAGREMHKYQPSERTQ